MSEQTNTHSPLANVRIVVNDQPFQLADPTSIGRQVLEAAKLRPTDDYALVQRLADGRLEEIGPDEPVDVTDPGSRRFFAWLQDRLFYFTLDGRKYPWTDHITGAVAREIAGVSNDVDLWLERRDEPDLLIEAGSVLSLKADGVERLYTRRRSWKLDVQGVEYEFDHPNVVVREALVAAHIDLTKPWIVVLLVKGQPKETVSMDRVIDLRMPGVERLRLMPDKINNGDCVPARRDFALLPKDEAFLTMRHPAWEAVIDQARRWLVIRDYPVPVGFNVASTTLSIEIPGPYPAAEIDMFYCHPALSLVTGVPIPQTEHPQPINGVQFQRWSRHRDPGMWSPTHDSVITHMGLVEESMLREVGQ